MEVSLRQVSKENYEEVCELDVTKEQEDFVACNMWSIVESKYNEGYETRVIYLKEEPVGFFMWVKESSIKVSIWRFMVDKNHQQKSIVLICSILVLKYISLMNVPSDFPAVKKNVLFIALQKKSIQHHQITITHC